MNGVGVLGHQPLPCTASAHSFEDTRQTFNCQHCNVTLKGKIQYEAHINSRRHKKTVASQKKKARRTKPSLTPASVIGTYFESVSNRVVGRTLFASVFRLKRLFWTLVSTSALFGGRGQKLAKFSDVLNGWSQINRGRFLVQNCTSDTP